MGATCCDGRCLGHGGGPATRAQVSAEARRYWVQGAKWKDKAFGPQPLERGSLLVWQFNRVLRDPASVLTPTLPAGPCACGVAPTL